MLRNRFAPVLKVRKILETASRGFDQSEQSGSEIELYENLPVFFPELKPTNKDDPYSSLKTLAKSCGTIQNEKPPTN
jgi:hypothetical protein